MLHTSLRCNHIDDVDVMTKYFDTVILKLESLELRMYGDNSIETHTVHNCIETHIVHNSIETHTVHNSIETYAVHNSIETHTVHNRIETYFVHKHSLNFGL